MNIKQKVTGAIVTGAMMAAVVAPTSFAATNTVSITGGGAFSASKAKVVNKKTSVVAQGNITVANTNVKANSNTGGNKSSFNTGGSNSISTGKATTGVVVVVGGNTNTNTSSCDCETGSNSVTLSGGGAFSYKSVVVVNSSNSVVLQGNASIVNTNVNANSNTGGNSNSFNTKGGNTTTTNNAETGVEVGVEGSTNTNN